MQPGHHARHAKFCSKHGILVKQGVFIILGTSLLPIQTFRPDIVVHPQYYESLFCSVSRPITVLRSANWWSDGLSRASVKGFASPFMLLDTKSNKKWHKNNWFRFLPVRREQTKANCCVSLAILPPEYFSKPSWLYFPEADFYQLYSFKRCLSFKVMPLFFFPPKMHRYSAYKRECVENNGVLSYQDIMWMPQTQWARKAGSASNLTFLQRSCKQVLYFS